RGWAAPAGGSRGLQLAGRDQGGQPGGVFALLPPEMSLAAARCLRAVQVDVVGLLRGPADFLDLEAAAEVGGQLGQEVVGLFLADTNADDAGRLIGRLDAQADEPGGLGARLALTGGSGLGSVHLAFLSQEGMPRAGVLLHRRPTFVCLSFSVRP